jgi:hypothetical protein
MKSVKEQKICIKLWFKVRKTDTKTCSMLYEASGGDASSQTTTYEWFRHFKNGRTSTDDKQCGRPSISSSEPLIAQVRKMPVEVIS